MALIDDIKRLCDRLAPLGWRDLLMAVTSKGLDIQQTSTKDLQSELTKVLPSISRTLSGFEDFASTGQSAVSPGKPSLSLLYHALASPLVLRDQDGNALKGFATPVEFFTNALLSWVEKSRPSLILTMLFWKRQTFAELAQTITCILLNTFLTQLAGDRGSPKS